MRDHSLRRSVSLFLFSSALKDSSLSQSSAAANRSFSTEYSSFNRSARASSALRVSIAKRFSSLTELPMGFSSPFFLALRALPGSLSSDSKAPASGFLSFRVELNSLSLDFSSPDW
jgi:hypothetical protein